MRRQNSFYKSLLIITVILLLLVVGIFILKADIHILLLIAVAFTLIASKYLGFSYNEVIDGMASSISQAMPAMMIFIMIGVVISSWIISGTVPGIIYYGLQIIRPTMFLPVGLLLCSITSLATGTSWGTAGTIGVALMGMGHSLGIPAPITAGMVISGAYFGDKMSPVSDTTNLSATAATANIYDHIKSMLYTTLPSYLLTIFIFTLIGLKYSSNINKGGDIQLILQTIESQMNMSPIIFVPMVTLFTLNIKKIPAIPAMMVGSLVALIIAIILQKMPISEAILALNYGYVSTTGVEIVDNLLTRGGIQSMMWTFSLAFIAISLGGVLQKLGILPMLVKGIISKNDSPGYITTTILLTTTLLCALTGEVYLAIILSGNLFVEEFKNKGIKVSMLSRLLEEGGTLTQVFIPWTTGAAFMATTLGVSTFEYAPYALLNYINPLLSIILSSMGIFFWKENKELKEYKNENISN